MNRPFLAYISQYNFKNVLKWSGLMYYIAKALEKHYQIEYISPLKVNNKSFYKIKRKLHQTLQGQNYWFDREPAVIKGYASQIQKKLKNLKTDIIVSPGTIPVSLLDTNIPIVIYTDAPFSGLLNFYPRYSNLTRQTIKNGHYLEQKALEKASLVVYSSDWAAQSAIHNYGVNPNKVKVVPFGANIDRFIQKNEIFESIRQKSKKTCNLLFVGVDWYRKGAGIAVEVATKLNKKGIQTILHVVGCHPDKKTKMPDYVKLHGFFNKANPDENTKLQKLFFESHFLIVPTLAEAYGLVFCEGNAHGLPAVSFDVGGVSTIIKNDINGRLFEPNPQETEKITSWIKDYFTDFSKYEKLACSSYEEYANRLNWNVAGKTLSQLLYSL